MRVVNTVSRFAAVFSLGLLASTVITAQENLDKTEISATLLAAKEKVVNSLPKPEDKFLMTTDMAVLAFNAGDNIAAGMYAKDLLNQAKSMKDDWNYGNALHKAHLVLGRIALAAGDMDEAKSQLLLAGQTPGSPQLDTFGPDMLFARELLEKGEKKAVIQYFTLCSNFWKMNDGKLDEWTEDVKNDRAPDFGPNVRYVF